MEVNDPYSFFRERGYITDPTEEAPVASREPTPYASESRGFLAGTASGIARGFVDAASTIGAGLEEAGIENPLRAGAKYAKENIPFLMPDIPEAFGMDTGAYGAVKRLPQQLTSSIAGTLGGGVIGGLVAGPAGAVVGSTGAMVTQFGLGTKREKTEEYLAKNPGDYDGAENYSNIYAASELGFELASNAFAALTFGTSKLLTGVAKAGAKATAREMIQFSGKEFGKDALKAGGVEMASEMATYGAESAADVSYGMGEGINGEGLTKTAVTTAGMSLVFAAVGAKYQAGQRKQLRSMLEDGTPEQQAAAAGLISKELKREGDPDLAGAWDTYTSSSISNNVPISLNDKFIELGNKINNVDVKVEDITSANPDIQKNAVDKVLKDAGIGEDGGPVQEPILDFEGMVDQRDFGKKALAYNKDRIIGTEATRQEQDRLLKRQGYEARRSEAQLAQTKPTTDPLSVLDKMYNEQEAAAKTKEMEAEYQTYDPSAPKNAELIQWEKDQAIAESEVYAANNKKSILSRLSPEMAQRIEELKKSKEVEINTLMQEVLPDSNNLPAVVAKAEVVVEKSIKGSKKQKQAKEVVKAAKAMQVAQEEVKAAPAPVVEAPVAPTPKAEPAVLDVKMEEIGDIEFTSPEYKENLAKIEVRNAAETRVSPTVKRRKAADKVVAPAAPVVEPTTEYTIDDTQKPDDITIASMEETKGVERATTLTPDKILEIQEAEKATLSEREAREAQEEAEEASIPELEEVVSKANSPLLSAVVKGDSAAVASLFPAKTTGPLKKVAILKAFKKLGEKTVAKHITSIKELVEKAIADTTLSDTKNKKGAKRSDAVSWPENKTGAKVTIEEGAHKITGQSVVIEKMDSKKLGLWEIRVDGKKVGEARGQVAARQAAETFVEPLSKEELANAKKLSLGRTDQKLSAEDKELLSRYENSLKVNKTKEVVEKEKVADVVKIDPVTGKKTVVPYTPPPKEVLKKIEKADTVVEKEEAPLSKEDELAALMKEQEEDDFGDESLVTKTRKKEQPNYNTSPALDKILKDVKWDLDQALAKLTTGKIGTSNLADIKYVEERIRNRERNKSKLGGIFQNADTALNHILNKGTELEKALAKLILRNTTLEKRMAIRFETDYNGARNFYKNDTNTITLTSDDTSIALHEFMHAVTVREMDANPELKKQVNNLMTKVKMELRYREMDGKKGGFTQAQMDYINKNNTSSLFKSNNPEALFFGDELEIAYGLINVNEFMAQSMSKVSMVEMMKSIKLENPKGFIQTMWDAIVDIVGKALGLSPLHYNALSEVLILGVQAMNQSKVSVNGRVISESLTKTPDDVANFHEEQANKHALGKSKSETIKETLGDAWKKSERKISETFQGIDKALAHISKDLASLVERMDYRELTTITKRSKEALPFVQQLTNLAKKDPKKYKQLEYYLDNYGSDPIIETRIKNLLGDTSAFDAVMKMIEEVRAEQETFGISIHDAMEQYFPRVVKDYDGLVSYMRKQEDWGMMDEALKEAEDQWVKDNPGVPITDSERGHILGTLIRTGRPPGFYLKNPTSSKQRSIKIVNASMMKFYHTPAQALAIFIRENTSAIETNRMLGITGRKKVLLDINRQWKTLDRLLKSKIATDKEKNEASMKYAELQAKLKPLEQEVEGSLGDVIAKSIGRTTRVEEMVDGKKVVKYVHADGREIHAEDQRRAKELIRARITERGLSGAWSKVRTAALLGSLTQVGTGLVQLSDNTWSMYRSGALPTLQAIFNVLGKKQMIKEDFINFEDALREFNDSNKYIDMALKFSGLSIMDKFGKKVSMEATLLSSKKMSKESFVKEWGSKLHDAGEVYDNLQEGKVIDETKFMVASRIAEFQPIYKSSMTQTQATAGNARILYFLKSYALRASNNFYEETIRKMREGDVKGGLKNLAHLGGLFVMMGASTDWLRDWLNGRSPKFSDSMIDTLLTLGLMSRYSLDKGVKDGFLKGTVGGMILPPMGLIDLPTKDLIGLISGEPTVNSLKLIPFGGTMMYGHLSSDGQKSAINNQKKSIMEDAVSGSTPGNAIAEVNADIRKYNVGKKKADRLAPITSGTIATARKKEREKNAK